MKRPWYKQKTTWTGIAAIAGALVALFQKAVSVQEGVSVIIAGLAFIMLEGATIKR